MKPLATGVVQTLEAIQGASNLSTNKKVTMNNNSTKAQRAQVTLAGIPLNVYLLPNGSYRLAGRSVTDAIGIQHKSLVEIMGVKSLKHLPGADLSLGDKSGSIKAETGESFIPVSLDDAVTYWGIMATKGNIQAVALLTACAAEALERRADAVFGKLRNDDEREQRAQLRRTRLFARRQWTDIIKDHQEALGYYRTVRGQTEFRNLTVIVNEALFGQPHFKCDRDNMTFKQQRDIENFEFFLGRQSDKFPDKTPRELINETLAIWL